MKAAIQKPKPRALLTDLRQLITEARQNVARHVNTTLVLLYWNIGQRIRRDILKEKRGEYGEQIVAAVGRELTADFGRGYSEKNLWHMIRFTEAFPDERIVSALQRQLSWTHFKQINYLEDPLKRDFYAEMLPKKLLERKLHGAIRHARERLAQREEQLPQGGTR